MRSLACIEVFRRLLHQSMLNALPQSGFALHSKWLQPVSWWHVAKSNSFALSKTYFCLTWIYVWTSDNFLRSTLVELGCFGDPNLDMKTLLMKAWEDYHAWCKENKVHPGQGRFTPGLVSWKLMMCNLLFMDFHACLHAFHWTKTEQNAYMFGSVYCLVSKWHSVLRIRLYRSNSMMLFASKPRFSNAIMVPIWLPKHGMGESCAIGYQTAQILCMTMRIHLLIRDVFLVGGFRPMAMWFRMGVCCTRSWQWILTFKTMIEIVFVFIFVFSWV